MRFERFLLHGHYRPALLKHDNLIKGRWSDKSSTSHPLMFLKYTRQRSKTEAPVRHPLGRATDRYFIVTGMHVAAAVVCFLGALEASRLHPGLDQSRPIRWVSVPDLPQELMIFETVFWEPLDTVSLREMIRDHSALVKSKSVLEIGTGSGLLALCCAQVGAHSVIASDINPNAIRCAKANAARLGSRNIEFRLVESGSDADTGAFSVVSAEEQFDVILSNPPWEDDVPRKWGDYALYDPSFDLLQSIVKGFRTHSKPQAKLMLAYGCVAAIQSARMLAENLGLHVLVLDDRDPSDLPAVFLPGMVLGIEENRRAPTAR